MALFKDIRVLVFILYLCLVSAYEVPDVKIQALRPKGIRASIPDAPNLALFVFQANVNRAIDSNDVGSINGEVTAPTNGKWVFQDLNVQLKVGDVISYYVFVSVDSSGYIKDKLSYIVTDFVDPDDSTQPNTTTSQCTPSITQIRGGIACAGQTIFEDDFTSLREDVWQVEQYIPFEHPEYPFVSYQRPTVSVSNGNLRISPTLQQLMPGFNNESIYSGSLNLFSGCTGSATECTVQASGPSILPPIASGRLTSKGLAFTYGIVHIRAKLPRGDWIYPEILLEPFLKRYGNGFSSGVLKIASVRGNDNLNIGVNDFSNKLLYGGPIMDFNCRNYLIQEKKLESGRRWTDDYHVFSLYWAPERITLSVDNEEWARIEPPSGGLVSRFPPHCRHLPRNLLNMGTKMAPFVDHFYITLGLAVGGITEFPDDISSNGRVKPWKNRGRKASLQFWRAAAEWLPSWANRHLLIDYVKVVAL